jgi:flagellar motility protein MotE (MotC chaperone)
MNRILQSPATVVIIAGVMFFGTIFAVLGTLHLGSVVPAGKVLLSAADDPSWKFHNPEIDQWIAQIKDERDALAVREQQLKEWEAQLAAQSHEISVVTQAVSRTQADFDKRILLFTEQEKENLKKQLKVISAMSPEGITAMLNEMADDDVARLLYAMKPDMAGATLDAMSKLGGTSAKRAAALTERIRDVLQMSATNNLTTNASP